MLRNTWYTRSQKQDTTNWSLRHCRSDAGLWRNKSSQFILSIETRRSVLGSDAMRYKYIEVSGFCPFKHLNSMAKTGKARMWGRNNKTLRRQIATGDQQLQFYLIPQFFFSLLPLKLLPLHISMSPVLQAGSNIHVHYFEL